MRALSIVFATFLLAASAAAESVVLLPLENRSGTAGAVADIEPLLAAQMTAKGWQVVAGDAVRAQLETQRVRYLDSVDADARKTLLDALQSSAYVSGTLLTYARGRDPIVALSAQLVRADGSVAWSDVRALSSAETEGFFGAGRKTTVDGVAREVVAELLRRFPAPGKESSPAGGPSKPFLHDGPLAFRAADLDPRAPHLVCVLPFENKSGSPEAARVVTELVSLRLGAAQGFEVVDPATMRAAALQAGIASFRFVQSDDLVRLGAAVHTSLFLQGTVYDFIDPAETPGRDPRLQIEMSLVDVASGRVLWSAHHDRLGSDYIGLFMRGAATSAVALTDRVVGEIVQTGTAPASRAAAAGTAARKAGRSPEKHSELRSNKEK